VAASRTAFPIDETGVIAAFDALRLFRLDVAASLQGGPRRF